MLVHPEITPPDNFYHFRDTTRLYALGALFILVTLYLPKGITGALNGLRAPAPKIKEATA